MNMTDRQKRFCLEYLKDLNATQSAIRAGYSKASARTIGTKLLKDKQIQAKINSNRKKLEEKLEISVEKVIGELSKMAFFNPRDLLDEDGMIKPMSEINEDVTAGIVSLDIVEEFAGKGLDRVLVGRTKKLRTVDKVRALELLCKHLGLLNGDSAGDKESELQINVVYGKGMPGKTPPTTP